MLEPSTQGDDVGQMTARRTKHPSKLQLVAAIDEIGGEPLDGSGFEDEEPDEDSTGAALVPPLRRCVTPKAPR